MDAQPSDEELAKLVQSGDIESGNLLFSRYQSELLSHALRSCGKTGLADELAKDLLQEAYLKSFARFNEFRSPYKFAPWIKAFISNIAKERKRADRKKDEISGTNNAPEDINNIVSENDKTPYDELCDKDLEQELWPVLEKRLADLDESHQQVGMVMLEHFRNGEKPPSLDDIGKITGIPRRSVARYRDKIRQFWKPLCEKLGFPVTV